MNYDPTFIAELTVLRRDLHRAPELSSEENETAKRMAAWLAECEADEVITGLGGTGVAGIFDSGQPGPAILFRCELDALPIQETGIPDWRSRIAGKGHMCGHDGHMAILCGLARRLQAVRPKRGRVILLFQPAEETGAGARGVIDDVRFKSIKPDFAFGLHNLPGMKQGQAAIREGSFCFASEGMTIHLAGWTSHAAHPEDGRSPVSAMMTLAEKLPLLPRDLGMEPGDAIVTVSHARLGEPAFGISPGEGWVMATLRARTNQLQAQLMQAARDLANKAADKSGLQLEISTAERFAACSNDAEPTDIVRKACEKAGIACAEAEGPFRWSEDFGLFGRAAPSAFFVLGAGEHHSQLHNPDYDFPDEIIPQALAIFETIATEQCG